MQTQPQLLLLQKTMVTVEGVARRIDPDNDIWIAADPVVRRWIARELSPTARIRGHLEDGAKALAALARLADAPPPVPPPPEPEASHGLIWFSMGAAASALAFAVAAVLRG